VPVKVMREKQEKTLHITVDELDLDAEQQGLRAGRGNNNNNEPVDQGASGFGLTLQNVTPQIARRLQLPSGQSGAVITEVDPNSESARGLRAGDIILSVNGKAVSTASDAGRELQKVASGRIARILIWRDQSEQFVPVKKD
jgi:serine protease Do